MIPKWDANSNYATSHTPTSLYICDINFDIITTKYAIFYLAFQIFNIILIFHKSKFIVQGLIL